ncbi:MAG TPA: CDP-diacylglycerol--glycerol-3-phosphate 3-phosphatidyltransferase [bacterium]|nr:CDP-diacylglycerol--glycerol-3-phosphate 3-phosphatidyltransferase [bacterium]
MKKSDFLNAPNLISLFRLSIAPIILVLLYMEKYLNPQGDTLVYCFIAGVAFLLAAISDIFDGYLARKYNMITDIGKFLDPLADKVMVATPLILLVGLDRVPAWMALVIILREMIITGLRGLAQQRGTVIAASKLGKMKTVLQVTALVALLIHYPLNIGALWGGEFILSAHKFGVVFLYIAVFYTLYSGYDYLRNFIRSEVDNNAEKSE